MHPYHTPTKAELAAAENQTVPDIIAPGLEVLFCGINPSVYTAAVGHNFARPGNRFWPTLYKAGFTPHLFLPHEDRALLTLGYGITNVVDRATTSADQLAAAELVAGGRQLVAKVSRYKPKVLAILGVTAYRRAFGYPKAAFGLQQHTIGSTHVWVLPNPSGLNAHFPPRALAAAYQQLRLHLCRQ
ncbi:G/U mismatch-specific DNA glycosylase [Pontibacter liquoris]|uniref:G/U mismatch-specific DNA glycosylase n=1 Tax=Pontibacter liquoris TaxID=2905677 RepID=UPI001FA7FC4D|nr:G/U mismatch-specific DNA glycosylase [Pontibacter liquoris]